MENLKILKTLAERVDFTNSNELYALINDDVEHLYYTISSLLPLAKGYVAKNPGIKSTELILEDANQTLRGKNDTE